MPANLTECRCARSAFSSGRVWIQPRKRGDMWAAILHLFGFGVAAVKAIPPAAAVALANAAYVLKLFQDHPEYGQQVAYAIGQIEELLKPQSSSKP